MRFPLLSQVIAFYCFLLDTYQKATGGHDRAVPLPTTATFTPVKGAGAVIQAVEGDAADKPQGPGSDDDTVAEIDTPPKPVAIDGGAIALQQQQLKAGQQLPVVHIPVDAEQGAGSEAWRLVGPYMRMYGAGALSSSTLWNPEFIHMYVPGMGSQAYVVGRAYWRTIVVGVCDPLAHRDHWPEMLATFKRAFPHATFAHVGPDFAPMLAKVGLVVNDIGAETNILAQTWAYTKKTRTIRMAARDARVAGVTVREVKQDDLTLDLCKQLSHVTGAGSSWGVGAGGWNASRRAGASRERGSVVPCDAEEPTAQLKTSRHARTQTTAGDWVQKKSVKDQMLRVFIRHADYDCLHLQEGVRLFVAESPAYDDSAEAGQASEGDSGVEDDSSSTPSSRGLAGPGPKRRVDGFVLVDPLWRDGKAFGYVTSLNRMRREGHHGACDVFGARRAGVVGVAWRWAAAWI